jgi:hypothetical protein
MSTTPEYTLWRGMIQRCHNVNNSEYRNYGGRGIQVCAAWRQRFTAFFDDVGARPSPEMTLERRDNNGDYEPTNVCWATRCEQMLNTRLTREERQRRGRLSAMKRWSPDSHARK